MALRRSDSRRRRLVVDPSQTASQADEMDTSVLSSNKSSTNIQKDIRAYSFGANRRNVNKTTDLFPKRVVPYLLVVLGLLVCIGLINYGAFQASRWHAQIGDYGVSSLAVSGLGSIGSWFTSFLLILSALASLQTFALRKHRCDDYLGTYRLWAWMAGVLLLASLCCIVDLASIARVAIESLTEISFLEKAWLGPTIGISLLTILAGRVIYEVRRSQGSMTWMAAAWLGFTAAVLLGLPAVGETIPLEFSSRSMAGNCVLLGTASLLMAHLTYVRFIFLRAHGLIKLKAKKKVAKKKTKPKAESKAESKAKPKTKAKAKPSSKSKSSKTSIKTKAPRKKKAVDDQTDNDQSTTADEPEVVASSSKKKKASAKKAKQPEVRLAPETSEPSENPGSKKKLSLKEMATASRAKSKAEADRAAAAALEEENELQGVIKISKAQRRKQRKEARKNRKRAA